MQIEHIRSLIQRCIDAGDIEGLRRVEAVLNKLWAEVAVGMALLDPPKNDDPAAGGIIFKP